MLTFCLLIDGNYCHKGPYFILTFCNETCGCQTSTFSSLDLDMKGLKGGKGQNILKYQWGKKVESFFYFFYSVTGSISIRLKDMNRK